MSICLEALNAAWTFLKRKPAFAGSAILALTIGIVCCSLVFNIFYSVLLKPLPFPDADRMIYIQGAEEFLNLFSENPAQFMERREYLHNIPYLAAIENGIVNLE